MADEKIDAGMLIPGGSAQQPEKTDEELLWDGLDVLEPPLSFKQLAELYEVNNTYQKGLQFIARNVVANGWEWIPYDPEAGGTTQGIKEKAVLDNFLSNCNDEYTFGELVEKVVLDHIGSGSAGLEVARSGIGANKVGLPSKLFYMPIHTLRVARGITRIDNAKSIKSPFRTGQRLVQVEGFSDTKVVTWYNRYRPNPADRTAVNGYDTSLNAPMATNEVMWFAQHNPRSRYYGLPAVASILNEILLAKYARQFNVNEFENGLMARFMLIVEEGGQVSEGSIKALSEYTNEMNSRGKSSAIPIVALKGKGKLRKEPLTAEIKDMSYLDLLRYIREEVAVNTEVPLALLGIQEKATLSSDIADLERKVHEKVIRPLQDRIGDRFTKMANMDFGLTNWRLMLKSPNLKDEKSESEIAERETKMGVSSINDWRRLKGKDPVEGGDELVVWTPLGIMPVKGLVESVQMATEARTAQEVSKSVTAGLLGHKAYLTEQLRKSEIAQGIDDGIKESPYPEGAR